MGLSGVECLLKRSKLLWDLRMDLRNGVRVEPGSDEE